MERGGKQGDLPLPTKSRMYCATCGVEYTTLDELRKHYQSDLHVANVRLRVEGKPPMTLRQFNDSNPSAPQDNNGPTFSCQLCEKTFRTLQTLQSHVKSTAHLMKKEERILTRDSNAGSMLSSTSLGSAAVGLHRRNKAHHKAVHVDTNDSVPHTDEDVDEMTCLFCGVRSPDAKSNLLHLLHKHSFALPLPHRLKDLIGLLQYLARKVNGGMCICCDRTFKSLEGVRSHMKTMLHERIDLGPEYNDFYRSALDDGEAVVPSNDAVKEQVVLRDKPLVVQRRIEGVRPKLPFKPDNEVAVVDEAAQMIVAERKKAAREVEKREQKNMHVYQAQRDRLDLRLGIATNKFHPKGYDGEGTGA